MLWVMRTTIELRDDLRARLLQLSAERGEKGFSRLIEVAIDGYLGQIEQAEKRRKAALRLKGSLTAAEGAAMRARIAEARKAWR